MSNRNISRVKVLYASHRGFPWGGISTDTEQLLASALVDRVNLTFVETSPGRREITQSGRLDLRNILATFSAVNNFRKAITLNQPDVVHISTANGMSFVKHSLMVLVAKSRKIKIVLQPH